MKNVSCGTGIEPSSKFRHPLASSIYQNVPRGNMRPFGIDYTLPNCSGRRSAASITHTHHTLWQERHQLRTPMSCIGVDRKRSSKGRLCSIALAITSFIVLIVVLAIAGLALYMGISQTESPTSAIITFSCSAKVVRGDRFIGALEEKAQRYKRQIELLYQKSALGPALLSCSVDKFGKDGLTVYFRLGFNRKKLVENLTNIERAIKDIFLSDAFSKKPIFKNIRFDSRSISVKQFQDTPSGYLSSLHLTSTISPQNTVKSNKMGVVLKTTKNSTTTTTQRPFIREEPEINEDDLPVIQGSFQISKTEADITEKKTEATKTKSKQDKPTTAAPSRNTTFKESSVTSALYKIAGDKSKTTSKTVPSMTTFAITTPRITKSGAKTTIASSFRTRTGSTTSTSTTTEDSSTTEKFKGSPQLFGDQPWIPILPNLSGFAEPMSENAPVLANPINTSPMYTSFTNPGLSFHFQEVEELGSTSLRSHPIPVNKIPYTISYIHNTEPSKKIAVITEMTTNVIKTDTGQVDAGFVKVDTIKHESDVPKNVEDVHRDYPIKNISSIFYNLASSLDNTNYSSGEPSEAPQDPKDVSGHGQVEVVEVEVEELLTQTSKTPLVTLLPVKSNSGIGRPFSKKRFGDTNNLSVENRSFPSQPSGLNLEDLYKPNKTNAMPHPQSVGSLDNYHIMGVLNFATEGYNEKSSDGHDIVRFPKMEQENDNILPAAMNSSISATTSSSFKTSKGLTPEQIKQLSEISKVHNNETTFEEEPLISTKAISSSYSINHNGFKILTKTLNKIPNSFTKNDSISYSKNGFSLHHSNGDCEKYGFKCGDGKCLPETTKCNQLIDCTDGKDEQNCNCADYLKSQFLVNKICDGVVDCWDFSDENQCDWCKPGQYVCSNSKVCIDQEKICNGLRDCPQGDDERQCVTIASDKSTADEFPYYSEGYLMVRKYGNWGKLCIANFENVVSNSHISWEITDLGKAICKSMTYQRMESIQSFEEDNNKEAQQYFELTYTNEKKSKSNLSFKETKCPTKKVVKVTCQSLECGARPQAVRHIARVVGGGNAGLGAWPWQVALYKEGEFQCGATLLSSQWLLSAGHCFYRSPNEHWVARLGALRRGTTLPSPYEQLRTIVRIVVHPGYLDFGFINDISLLQMERPVVFSDYVRPVCLPQSNQVLDDGHLCTVIGWGQLFEVGRIFPDTLQEVQVPVISTAECRKRTLFLPLYKITDDMFCAGYERGGRDACLGDSGGPLMCPETTGRWTLYGITSNGYGCARANRPGVYTKVANYVDWISSYVYGDETRIENMTKISTSCSGHRCPLGECLPESRLCNGFIECSDASDEKDCQKS